MPIYPVVVEIFQHLLYNQKDRFLAGTEEKARTALLASQVKHKGKRLLLPLYVSIAQCFSSHLTRYHSNIRFLMYDYKNGIAD